MASKSTYTTSTGEKRYLVRWIDPATRKKKGRSFSRSKDADLFRVEVTRQAQLGALYQEPTVETFGSFVGIEKRGDDVRPTGTGWLERYRSGVRASSYLTRIHCLQPLTDLVDVRLDALNVERVESALAGKAPHSALVALGTLKMALRAAEMRGLRVDTRIYQIKSPRVTRGATQFLTPAEVEHLAECSSEPWLILFTAYTGLRRGEVTALLPEDVVGDAVHVRRSLGHTGTHAPKSSAGERIVPLAARAREALREQMARRPEGAVQLFCAPHGGAWTVSYIGRKFREWADAAGMPDVTMHALRHSYASWLIRANVHPKVIQELMGHSNISVTMDTYGHLFVGQKVEAIKALDWSVQ